MGYATRHEELAFTSLNWRAGKSAGFNKTDVPRGERQRELQYCINKQHKHRGFFFFYNFLISFYCYIRGIHNLQPAAPTNASSIRKIHPIGCSITIESCLDNTEKKITLASQTPRNSYRPQSLPSTYAFPEIARLS